MKNKLVLLHISTVEYTGYDGDKLAYTPVSWVVDAEDNPYATREGRLIPFSEAVTLEIRLAVYIRNNINGFRVDENNA